MSFGPAHREGPTPVVPCGKKLSARLALVRWYGWIVSVAVVAACGVGKTEGSGDESADSGSGTGAGGESSGDGTETGQDSVCADIACGEPFEGDRFGCEGYDEAGCAEHPDCTAFMARELRCDAGRWCQLEPPVFIECQSECEPSWRFFSAHRSGEDVLFVGAGNGCPVYGASECIAPDGWEPGSIEACE